MWNEEPIKGKSLMGQLTTVIDCYGNNKRHKKQGLCWMFLCKNFTENYTQDSRFSVEQ